MRSISHVLLLLGLLATLVLAAPGHVQKRSFKVERIPNPHFKGRNGPRELIKAYRKYRMPVPTNLEDAAQSQRDALISRGLGRRHRKGKHKGTAAGASIGTGGAGTGATAGGGGAAAAAANTSAGTGAVAATPESGDVEYLAPVDIGGQTINMDFDSGSSDMWVFNTQLSQAATQGHTVYDPTKSKSFQLMRGATFSISYGDGSGAKGNVGTDTVSIGGATVPNQAVQLATAVSQSFVEDSANNGLVGLAFSQLNTVQPKAQKTFFDNVMPTLDQPVFTADLRKNAVGSYEFGRIDNSKFTGAMAWIPVNTTQGFWQFSTSSFAVSNSTAQKTATSQAIADTGTTLMLASEDLIQGYYSQVPGAQLDQQAGGVTFPCNSALPDLQVDVGGVYMATIKGDDINFSQMDGSNSKLIPFLYDDVLFIALEHECTLTPPSFSLFWWYPAHDFRSSSVGRCILQVAVRCFQRREQHLGDGPQSVIASWGCIYVPPPGRRFLLF